MSSKLLNGCRHPHSMAQVSLFYICITALPLERGRDGEDTLLFKGWYFPRFVLNMHATGTSERLIVEWCYLTKPNNFNFCLVFNHWLSCLTYFLYIQIYFLKSKIELFTIF